MDEGWGRAATSPRFDLSEVAQDELTELLLRAYGRRVIGTGGLMSETEQLRGAAESVARWLRGDGARRWLVLNGAVGTGKTTMARAMKDVLLAIRRHARMEMDEASRDWYGRRDTSFDHIWARYQFLPAPVMVHASLAARIMADGDDPRAETLGGHSMVLIDDFGTEPPVVNEWGTRRTPLATLIYARYDRRLPTVFTTNLRPEEIGGAYGERVEDRFEEMADWVGFGSGSYRGMNRNNIEAQRHEDREGTD